MEDFVSIDIAKVLKEKGFNIPCVKHCINGQVYISPYSNAYNYECEETIYVPTISQVFKWLKDKFFLHISQKPYPYEDGLMWMYEIRKFNEYSVSIMANKTGFVEEEAAALAGIKYVLDYLI